MNIYHDKDIAYLVREFDSDILNGLDSNKVISNRTKYGENKLEEKKGRTIFQMILDQFRDFLVLILIIASIASILVGSISDGIVIILIVILNATLGVIQENKASNALEALKEMAAPKAKVIREGNIQIIESVELVPGDVVVLETGDYVPADLRLVESVNLKLDESALTGESVSVEKEADANLEEKTMVADRVNMAYMSTIVTYGRGTGVVVSTGMTTEIGRIASMLNEHEEEQTPLQKKLAEFGKVLGIICMIVCVIVFALGLARGQDTLEVFMTAISLAVAAIPEGLPAVVTVVLAMGMQKMIKKNAIVKKLAAVETLGSTTVICTDKTGTLTQNKMTVKSLYDGFEEWKVTGTGYSFEGEIIKENGETSDIDLLLKCMVLCNDSEVSENEVIGDPTEGSLVVAAAKRGIDKTDFNEKYPRLNEFPFDSDRKMMSTVNEVDGSKLVFTKGAPDNILEKSSFILDKGKIRELTDEDKKRIAKQNDSYANTALRVLGFAFKEIVDVKNVKNEEKNLIFLGLTGMMDPPREEVKDAISLCKKAGIRVVMITGDHITTSKAIAKEIGIIDSETQAMEGSLIDEYSDDEFKKAASKTNVFARVSPEHKVKIVDSIKSNGEVVAMTGDGVNDAPSLKRANIGIAMGITGTDVSKEAADMILTDDNFSSIVHAIEEGRTIYNNIRKFVGFLLSCNIGEILIIFIAMLVGWGTPLFAIQLLWVNLITDSLPAFALGLEKTDENVMEQKPRDPDATLVDKKMKLAIGFQAVGLAIAVLASYRIGVRIAVDTQDPIILSRTFCFITLIFGEMLRAYSARSESIPIYKMNVFSNKLLNISVFMGIALLFAVVYIEPLQGIFHTEALTISQLMIAIGLSIIPIITGEIAKSFKNRDAN